MTNNATNPSRGLLVICIAAFLVPFMGSSLNLALPQISDAFGLDAVTLTWMATAYLISTAIFQVPLARVADIVGRKRVFLAGILIFSLFTLLCGFSVSGTMLIACRFLSGIGSAMMFGTSMAILTSLFPPPHRGRAMGINTAVVYASLAAGPFVGGMLTRYLGWQSIFFVCAGAGLVAFTLGSAFLKGEWIEARGQKFDLRGSVVYALALFGMIYGFSELPSVWGFVWLAAGIGAMVLFVYVENRSESPVFDVKLFSGNRIFALSSLAALVNYAATAAIAFMLSLYLQYVRGFEASHAGMILISQAVVQALFSLAAGRMSDRRSPAMLATTGMAIIVAGLAGLVFLSPATPVWILVSLLVLLGAGFGIFSSPNTNVVMSSVDARHYGQASAAMGTMRLTGQAFSMGIAGMAISLQIGSRKITPDLHPQFMESLRITMIVFVALCLAGVWASSRRTKG